jgi:hypothetical protein
VSPTRSLPRDAVFFLLERETFLTFFLSLTDTNAMYICMIDDQNTCLENIMTFSKRNPLISARPSHLFFQEYSS